MKGTSTSRCFSLLLRAACALVLVLSSCGDPLNTKPEADAGEDQLVETESTVYLDGSGSSDPNLDDDISYDWTILTMPSGSSASLSNSTSSSPSFDADVSGTYIIGLTVSDGLLDSGQDKVTVYADLPPEVSVSGYNGVDGNGSAYYVLDAADTTDEDGDSLEFEWTMTSRPSGSEAVISEYDDDTAYFYIDVEGDYEVTLVVSDGYFESEAEISIDASDL